MIHISCQLASIGYRMIMWNGKEFQAKMMPDEESEDNEDAGVMVEAQAGCE